MHQKALTLVDGIVVSKHCIHKLRIMIYWFSWRIWLHSLISFWPKTQYNPVSWPQVSTSLLQASSMSEEVPGIMVVSIIILHPWVFRNVIIGLRLYLDAFLDQFLTPKLIKFNFLTTSFYNLPTRPRKFPGFTGDVIVSMYCNHEFGAVIVVILLEFRNCIIIMNPTPP